MTLRGIVANLGKQGGLISSSVYDTAQVLRYGYTREHWPTLGWLLDRQHADGGWGDPHTPRARDLPTLAVVLALHTIAPERNALAIQAGLDFLHNQAIQWEGGLSYDIPVGIELLLPKLLEEAHRSGLRINARPYTSVIRLGQRRRQMLAGRTIPAGTTPIHSWEALDTPATAALIDGSGAVGHSPAATAAWLRATQGCAALAEQRAAAHDYLEQAALATGTGIPGVVPTVWPITNFERVWVLYGMALAGILDHPALNDVVRPQLKQIADDLRPDGLGMSSWFTTDGDITATTLALLASAGMQPDQQILERFANQDGGYHTYPGELQRSLSATTHAVHALTQLGADPGLSLKLLLSHRAPDGTWSGDKWHASWLYLTSHVIAALCAANQAHLALDSVPGILARRRSDGSWGANQPSLEDTTYAVLALQCLERVGILPEAGQYVLNDALAWIQTHMHDSRTTNQSYWIGKELYRPQRIVQSLTLSALTAPTTPALIERVV